MADGFKNLVAGGQRYVPQSSDPSNPKEGDMFYSDGTARAKGLWEYKNGGWAQIGAGNGDLSVYRQFDAEDGDLTGFSNVVISSSSPIAGDNSYTVSTFPATFPSISMEERHGNKTHSMEAHYSLTSGTAKLVVKDNAANVLEELEISDTVTTKVILTQYISTSVTSIQLSIEDVSSATGLKIDDVIFSDDPFVYKQLSNDTDWTEYTPTFNGLGTVTGISFFYRRVGDSIEVQGRAICGTSTASELQIGLPSGLTISSTKVPTVRMVGDYGREAALSSQDYNILATGGDTYFNVGDHESSNIITPLNGNGVSASGEDFTVFATAAIEGWTATTGHVVTPATSNVSDPASYTPTYSAGFGTVTNNAAKHWREGKFLHIQGTFSTGTTTTSEGTVSIPSGLTIDADYLSADQLKTTASPMVGHWMANQTGTSQHGAIVASTQSSTTVLYFCPVKSVSAAGLTPSTSVSGNVIGSSTAMSYWIKVPIVEYSSNATFLAAVPTQQVAYVKDVKSSGTDGGAFTSGSYQTRDLNTLEGDTSFVSLSSNQFTLPAGKYIISARGSAYQVQNHKLRIYNITDSSAEILGDSYYTFDGATVYSAELDGSIEISSSKTFELQHRGAVTRAADGFGVAASFGDNEVYTQVKITKLK